MGCAADLPPPPSAPSSLPWSVCSDLGLLVGAGVRAADRTLQPQSWWLVCCSADAALGPAAEAPAAELKWRTCMLTFELGMLAGARVQAAEHILQHMGHAAE
eukprot:1153961-Pelagomonas_calceolata.AAC.11